MAITLELMAIIMDFNDRTHKTINFKKRKAMDDFKRNLIALNWHIHCGMTRLNRSNNGLLAQELVSGQQTSKY